MEESVAHTVALEGALPEVHGRVKPPFGYYGAKQRIATKIIETLPPHNCWVEVFCGSAAITLAKPAAPIEVINDLDGEVTNVFEQLRSNSAALCTAITLTPYAREEFELARYGEPTKDPLERARRFLVATMMTINSTTASKTSCGFSFSQSYTRSGVEARVSRWINLPKRIEQVVERFRRVRIEKRDACEIVKMFADRPATLMYLDPPYFVKRAHGYVIDAKDEAFHRELLKLCVRSRAMLLISGYRNRLYDAILTKDRGWTRSSIKTITRDTTGKNYERTEVLWRNDAFKRAHKAGKVPIRLSKMEAKENKVNPARSR
ncbi:MAG: DNA adenine methylase [Deltaproteobacteria bacterium]|nr:DNA adenine methylase [Deltaproteobacteria bacterium]